MNKLVLSIIFYLFSLTVFSAAKENFDQANSSYASNNYEEAKSAYLQLINDGHYSAELYYNLGNTYFKLNDIAPAILYLEKAKKLDPLNEDIRHNLALANQQTVDKKAALGDDLLSSWWGTIIKYQPLNRWAFYSILLLLSSALLIIAFIFSTQRVWKMSSFYGATLSFLSFVVVLFIGFQSQSVLNSTSHGIIFNASVTVVSEPNLTSTKLFTLHEGAKVELLNSENEWKRIRFSDGQIGWVKSDVLQDI